MEKRLLFVQLHCSVVPSSFVLKSDFSMHSYFEVDYVVGHFTFINLTLKQEPVDFVYLKNTLGESQCVPLWMR